MSEFEQTKPMQDVQRAGEQSPAGFRAGQLLAGRYEIISPLGQGGMGTVYKVRQVLLNKEFALKTIHATQLSEVILRRFQQEARATFSLDHAAIVSVKDFGLLDSGTPYLVMELLQGETLAARLKRTGQLPLDEAAPLFAQLCRGLAYAHERGVVHRDIKPSNIILLRDSRTNAAPAVKILDFGIAKFAQLEGSDSQALTRTGEIFGSPLYMSPEQCMGQKVDQRTDVYSLGCVFYEALTGAPPFVGENALSTMMKHRNESALTLRDASIGLHFPPKVESIIKSMLAKSPSDRYSDLSLVAEELENLNVDDANISKPALSVKENHIGKWSGRRAISLTVVVIVLIFLVGRFVSLKTTKSGTIQTKNIAKLPKNGTANLPLVDLKAGASNAPPADDSMSEIERQEWLENKLNRAEYGHLTLTGAELDDRSFKLIAEKGRHITSISFFDCSLQDPDFSRLSVLKLREIKVQRSPLSLSAIRKIAAFKHLKSLILADGKVTDDVIPAICAMSNLVLVDLTGSSVSNEAAQHLLKLPKLEQLFLNRCLKVGNTAMRDLANSRVYRIELAETKITDEVLLYLAQSPSLSTVNLSETAVTARGIDEFCKRCRSADLKKITLKGCPKISPEDLLRLRAGHAGILFIDSAH